MPPTVGERWAREELRCLREARFSRRALSVFIASAQRRANETRAKRPELAAQARRWQGLGAGAWLGLAAAGRQPYRRRLRSGLGWWAGVALMLDWHLGMIETEDGHPVGLSAADAITLARAWLVPVIADDLDSAALLTALISDGLDGAVARTGRPTRAGRDLDGLVDACVLVAALRAGRRHELISRSVIGLELTRLGVGVAYSLGTYLVRARPPEPALTGAARALVPVRFAGLIAASRGRRALADALLSTASAAGLLTAGHAAISSGAVSPRVLSPIETGS